MAEKNELKGTFVIDDLKEKILQSCTEYVSSDKLSLEDIQKYISNHVGELNIAERTDILQMIINSSIDNEHIQEKGDGTQIKYSHIHRSTLVSIYNFIQNKISHKMDALRNFPDEVED